MSTIDPTNQPHTAPTPQARDEPTDIADHAAEGAPTLITQQGEEIAVEALIELLPHYQPLTVQKVMRLVLERMSSPELGIPLEQVLAEMLEEPE